MIPPRTHLRAHPNLLSGTGPEGPGPRASHPIGAAARRLALALALAGCQGSAAPAEPAAADTPAAPAAAIAWTRAAPPIDLSLVEAPARVLLAPGSSAGVAPPFPARVTALRVQPGQAVAAGDPIAEVTMPELIQAAGDHQAASTRLQAYERRRDQLESLAKEGLARLAEISEIDVAIAEAQAQSARALATLKVAGVDPQGARALLRSGGKVTLRAPIAGVVTEVLADLGDTYDPARGPLCRLLGESPPRIEARFTRVPPADARFELRLDARPPIPLRTVTEAPAIDGRDAALPIWFEPQEPMTLRPGTIGQVVALLGDTAGVVAVPPRSVTLHEGRAHVVGKERGPIVVTVLASAPEAILVRAVDGPPLRPGDELAADAAAVLRPGGDDE